MKTRIISVTITAVACLGLVQITPTALAGIPCPGNVVTIPTDSGPGSLRDAILCANPGDTITFNTNGAFAAPQTIVLLTGELVVDKNLTILGPGANRLTISGNHASRVFHIGQAAGVAIPAAAVGPSITVTIAGLTITNSVNSTAGGGGILNDHATLTLSNCTVTGNSAIAGGGIWNDGAVGGGGATLTIVNTTVSDNQTTSGVGAGIWNDGAFSGGGATLTVANSTVSRNHSVNVGGGIFNDGRDSGNAAVTVLNSTLSGNTADGDGGGGIGNSGTGGTATLTVSNSTLSGNSSTNGIGGGIDNEGSGGSATVEVVNSTFSGNAASDAGGINSNGRASGNATLTVLNSTFSGNSGEMASSIYINSFDGSSTLEIGSTILNAAGSGTNIFSDSGTITSDGYNLSSDGGVIGTDSTGSLNATGDQTNTPPQLGPLQDNGGPTLTHAPLCISPAIDAGTNFLALTTDQRGFARTVGGATDIGAVELAGATYTVSNTTDSGPGSLRQAILDANAHAGIDTIVFNPGVTGTITLTSGELHITDCLFLDGPGATNVAVNGNHASSVFHVSSNIVVTIAGLTITNGFASPKGAGIYNDHSTLTVSNCTISGNVAAFGTGIENDGDGGSATLTVVNSTISSNQSSGAGAGIRNDGDNGDAMVTIANSTVSGNFSDNGGGGIFNRGVIDGSATLIIENTTFSGNSATTGPGGILNVASSGGSSATHIGSTILDAGASGTNLTISGGTITSDGYNLSSDDGGGFLTQSTDFTNTNAMLGPLQLNGGQTPTHALLSGSPAIDAGTNFAASATDQRGTNRTVIVSGIVNGGDGTDIGAFEVQAALNHPPVASCTNITVSADTNCMATVNVSDVNNGSNDPDPGDSITLSFDASSLVTSATLSGTGAHSLTLYVTDTHGAQDSCAATVTVKDTTPPSIMCPSNQVANATMPSGTVVNYPAAQASDNCGVISSLTYSKNSGTVFPIGTTTVTSRAIDDSSNTNSCTFTVKVKSASEQLTDLMVLVNGLQGVKAATKNALVVKLNAAQKALGAGNTALACSNLKDFISLASAQAAKKQLTTAQANLLIAEATRIRAVLACP